MGPPAVVWGRIPQFSGKKFLRKTDATVIPRKRHFHTGLGLWAWGRGDGRGGSFTGADLQKGGKMPGRTKGQFQSRGGWGTNLPRAGIHITIPQGTLFPVAGRNPRGVDEVNFSYVHSFPNRDFKGHQKRTPLGWQDGNPGGGVPPAARTK